MAINQITGIPSYPPPPPGNERKVRIPNMQELLEGNTVQVPTMGDLLGPQPQVQSTLEPIPTSMPRSKFTEPRKSIEQSTYEAMPPAMQKTGKGVMRGVSKLANPMLTGPGLAQLAAITAATAFGPPVVIGLLKLGFTAQGIHDLAMKLPEAQQAFQSGDEETGISLLTQAVPSLGMTLAGTRVTPGEFGALGEAGASAAGKLQDFGKAMTPDLQNLAASEAGFITLEILDKFGNQIGTRSFQGGATVPGGYVGDIPSGAKVRMVMSGKPTGLEVPKALEWAYNRVPETNIEFIDATSGGRTPVSREAFIGAASRASVPQIPPPPTSRPAPRSGMGLAAGEPLRTPGGRRSTVTDPFKLQKMQEERPYVEMEAPTPPVTPKVQPEIPTTPLPEGYQGAAKEVRIPEAPPQAAAQPAQPIPGSMLEQAFVAMMEHNKLLSEQLRLLTERVMGGQAPAPTASPVAPPTAAAAPPKAPQVAPTEAAVKPPVATTPEGDLASQITAAMQAAPKVELSAADKGIPIGKGKKGPVSYVGKTVEEKYAPKEPAAQPEAIKAAATPTTPEELKIALEAFERGEGRPINVVRRGLGDAKPTRGTLLYNIKDMRGKPTEHYAYMPENWTGDPFSIKISEVLPRTGGRTHVMNVPRHAQRTYDLGMEVAVPRKADIVKGTRVKLPDGSLGTHVEDVVGGKDAIKYFMKNLRDKAKQGDQDAIAKFRSLQPKLAEKGYPTLARVALDDGRWIDFIPDELTKVEELAPSTTKPSTQIKPKTAEALKEVESRMKAAGGERAQPEKMIQQEGEGISGEAIAKAKGLVRPMDDLTKQRIKDQLIAEAKRNRQKPVHSIKVEEPIKPTPPPTGTKPAEVKAPEAGDAMTRILNKYKEQLAPMEAQEAKQGFRLKQAEELRAKIKNIESRMAPKSEAKIIEPPPSSELSMPPGTHLPDFSTMSPTNIRTWGEKQVKAAKVKGQEARKAERPAITKTVLGESQQRLLTEYQNQLKAIEAVEAQIGGPVEAGNVLRSKILDLERGTFQIPPPPK